MTEVQTLSCSRCGASISSDELNGGLAVRVDGNLVCPMCVDTLPGEAVVRINQVRAMRGLEATTYAVKVDQLPRLQLFSFTTSANVTSHRRKLASDGFFEAPPLPPPAERQRIPTPSSPKVVTDRVARGLLPARTPMLIAAGGTLVVLIGIALALTLARPEKKPAANPAQASEVPPPRPVQVMKTRLDYPVEPLQAWTQAAQDHDCPTLVLQGIGQELVRKRGLQLDDADLAIAERRPDDATALANAMTVPDDIAFRELHHREQELRARVLAVRTLATAPVAPPSPLAIAPPVVAPVPAPPPAQPKPRPPETVAAPLVLKAEEADLAGTKLQVEGPPGQRNIGFWTNGADTARWSLKVETPGRYRVDLLLAIGGAPTEAVLEIGDRQLPAALATTGSWTSFTTVTLGVVELPRAGRVAVRLRARTIANWQPLNISAITLVPSTEPETAQPIPPPVVVGITPWRHLFVTGARDKPPREVALDGSEFIPPGLPGGVTQVFRSTRSQALRHHAAFLDLANAPASNGGVVLLVHPGRNDRNELIPSLTDAKGTTVKFDPVALPNGEWTTVVLPVTPASGLDASQLLTLALEDDQKAAQIPDDSGFFIAHAVSVSGRAPTAADLGLRPSALLPDANRLRNLPHLLEVLAKNRKRPNAQKLLETGRMRFLLGGWSRNQEWRLTMRKQVEPALSGNTPGTMMSEMTFTEAWLDAMTRAKGKDGVLDPQLIHLAVIWTGGDELTAFPDPAQAVNGFWKRRLEQLIDVGILPLVIIGPNFQKGERRAQADQLWQQFVGLPPVKVYSMPVIDLRALPTTDEGTWDATTAALASHLVADAITETMLALRRLGAVK